MNNPNINNQTPESRIKEPTNTSPCQGIKDDLVECIRFSDCMNNGGTFHECMKSKDLDQECKDLLYAFFKCRKDMFDTRNRFRGNVAAMAHTKELSEKKTKGKTQNNTNKDNGNNNNDNNDNNNSNNNNNTNKSN
ncbi:hypothetical protein RB653_005860 [Dictyostelium firmibasis]|uniref:CHCH domain-containing protein n=1 Tax=Dictyostelium firmibasis TaxID=79012 RepID=A0AAN7U8R7_9MYCE